MSKSVFGSIRQLPSGRYQVRYQNDGLTFAAPSTFATKADANAWLSEVQTDIRKHVWIDPDAGSMTFRTYADQWLDDRVDLRPGTASLYRILLDKWLHPFVGDVALAAMTPELWRRWHTKACASKPGSVQPGKAYKLAHSILNTAVDDRRIIVNCCVVKGAAKETSPERPTASIVQIDALADAIDREYRALVLLGAYCSLRFGEAAGLRRRHVDILHGTITIEGQAVELADGSVIFGAPKTKAGLRTVAMPRNVRADIEAHLSEYVDPDPEALLFTAPRGGPLRRGKFRFIWLRACKSVGVTGLHFHDLRGSGATLAATQGATPAELMHRLGHSSVTAAMRYQHATIERDRAVSDAMSDAIDRARAAALAEADATPEPATIGSIR